MRRILLPMIFLFILSCDNDPISLVNCQDSGNDCYINSPENVVLYSYSPSAISINIPPSASQLIKIQRYLGEIIDTTYTLSQDDSGLAIDSLGINIDNNYSYLIRYENDSGGISDYIESSIQHDFGGLNQQDFNLEIKNENAIGINWTYDLDADFSKDFESLNWKVTKEKYIEDSQEWINYGLIDTIIDVSEDNNYSITDNSDIELNDSLRYSLLLEIEDIASEAVSNNLRIDFPQLEFIDRIPMNSSTIGIHWKVDSSTYSDDVQSVRIWNNISDNDIYYATDVSEAFIVDSLSLYSEFIVAGQSIEYTIQWCGLTECLDSTFYAITFPIYHMQYVPSVNVQLNGESVFTEAFYIDLYEFHQTIESNSSVEPNLSYPISDVTLQDARDYCNSRSDDFNYGDVYNNDNFDYYSLGFRLPTESEWYVAAAVLYDWDSFNVSDIVEYSIQVGDGVINCNYANILNCFNNEGTTTTPVGFYNGDNLPHQLSVSPNGLYDCNGNVKEWVERSLDYPHADNRSVLMGGDYMSSSESASNSHFTYESSEFSHPTIGFRTVIPAQAYLNSLRYD